MYDNLISHSQSYYTGCGNNKLKFLPNIVLRLIQNFFFKHFQTTVQTDQRPVQRSFYDNDTGEEKYDFRKKKKTK